LSRFRPHIFVPALSVYIPSILDTLIGPSPALRVAAAHALGGFVIGITDPSLDSESLITNISPTIQSALTQREPSEKMFTTVPRALNTALRSQSASHPGLSPYWAISAIASLIILAGPALLVDRHLLMVFRSFLETGTYGKLRVRTASLALWGPLVWTWLKWRHSDYLIAAGESTDNEELDNVKSMFSELLKSTAHTSCGPAFIGALLGPTSGSCKRLDLIQCLLQIGDMASKCGSSTELAIQFLERLVDVKEAKEAEQSSDTWNEDFVEKLIPRRLLSVAPGLLSQEVTAPHLHAILSSLPRIDDVRPLSMEERNLPSVWMRTKDAWLKCIEQLSFSPDDLSVPVRSISYFVAHLSDWFVFRTV
jgi:hypothetical protein